MDLILWRHAEAEEGRNDLARALTRRGQRQAVLMAGWLREHLPRDAVVWTSEARRSQQTGQALSRGHQSFADLNPDRSLEQVLQLLTQAPVGRTLVLVGHQPWIGALAASMMSGQDQPWSVKKGAIWWLHHSARDPDDRMRLKVMLTPSMLNGSDAR